MASINLANANQQEASTTILSLPVEIRTKIYGYLLQDTLPFPLIFNNKLTKRLLGIDDHESWIYTNRYESEDFLKASSRVSCGPCKGPSLKKKKASSKIIRLLSATATHCHKLDRIQTQILLVCKLVYAEAIPLLYSNRRFIAPSRVEAEKFFCDFIPPCARTYVRRLQVAKSRDDRLLWFWNRLIPEPHFDQNVVIHFWEDFTPNMLENLQYLTHSVKWDELDSQNELPDLVDYWRRVCEREQSMAPCAFSQHPAWRLLWLVLGARRFQINQVFTNPALKNMRQLVYYAESDESEWARQTTPSLNFQIVLTKIDPFPPYRPETLLDIHIYCHLNWNRLETGEISRWLIGKVNCSKPTWKDRLSRTCHARAPLRAIVDCEDKVYRHRTREERAQTEQDILGDLGLEVIGAVGRDIEP
ncbi:hypothetical protein QBC38DRAFT_445575 [Podospora fimiseda]|uniref:DUF7730 domain-containing protein n=1 Tax=Podospora fimiseda TaxID=252190 RepID=A0AAN7BLC1_9PEZI|nr:hypothetical protein QBC38DRAFT_445575 [Podospora fimiseda]